MSLRERLSELVRACFAGLWIESHEHEDALSEIVQLCQAESWRLASWDVDQGLVLHGQQIPVDTGTNAPAGEIVGITQQFCVYQLADDGRLCVANWRDLALDNVCPAAPLLPSDVTVNDRLNASATVLRELLAFQRLAELSPTQHAVMDELIAVLTR